MRESRAWSPIRRCKPPGQDIPKPRLEPKRQTNLSLGEKRGRNKYIAPKERIYMHPSLSFSFSFPHWGKIKNCLWAGRVISFTNEEKRKTTYTYTRTPFPPQQRPDAKRQITCNSNSKLGPPTIPMPHPTFYQTV